MEQTYTPSKERFIQRQRPKPCTNGIRENRETTTTMPINSQGDGPHDDGYKSVTEEIVYSFRTSNRGKWAARQGKSPMQEHAHAITSSRSGYTTKEQDLGSFELGITAMGPLAKEMEIFNKGMASFTLRASRVPQSQVREADGTRVQEGDIEDDMKRNLQAMQATYEKLLNGFMEASQGRFSKLEKAINRIDGHWGELRTSLEEEANEMLFYQDGVDKLISEDGNLEDDVRVSTEELFEKEKNNKENPLV
ncbi:hypothetical protein LWI28_019684 [Acer negundo]|uniref:Uncharacterized protein n=1 Tax=Acer negundo TaxID=4023 RepID=A0AAD5NH48_ACENE|nr:hypothetical protein LWI28_019684 [Acer negundo]